MIRVCGMTRPAIARPARLAPVWAAGMGIQDQEARVRYARALRRVRRELREVKATWRKRVERSVGGGV